MKRQFLLAVIVILALSISLNSCTNKSNSDNTKDQKSTVENDESETTDKSEQAKDVNQKEETENIDGIYSGTQNISGLELIAKLTISGNRWSATSQLGYDNPEYQNGVVKGTDLYDESGMIKIGYVSGNTARIDGYPSMRK